MINSEGSNSLLHVSSVTTKEFSAPYNKTKQTISFILSLLLQRNGNPEQIQKGRRSFLALISSQQKP